MSKSIFDMPGPQLTSNDNDPEPSLKEMVQWYYYNIGSFEDVELRDEYIKKWLKQNTAK